MVTRAAPAAPPSISDDHEHAWSSREVAFVEGGPVEELECDVCGDVWFR